MTLLARCRFKHATNTNSFSFHDNPTRVIKGRYCYTLHFIGEGIETQRN